MEYVLNITFYCTTGRKASLAISNVKPTITQAEIGTLMDSIISNNIFNPTNGEYIEKVGANLTQRTVTSYEF